MEIKLAMSCGNSLNISKQRGCVLSMSVFPLLCLIQLVDVLLFLYRNLITDFHS